MSHVTGTIQTLAAPIQLGPDFGPATNPPDTWTDSFAAAPPPIGVTKLVMLHFRNVNLPGNNRLEVDLGYDTDVFTAADGADFWTRPVNVYVLAGGNVPVRYIRNGGANGGCTIDKYARGEQHHGEQDPTSLSNCDPFFKDPAYAEPKYDPFWFCGAAPNWENARKAPAGDVRERVARSVGMILSVEESDFSHTDVLSSCSVTLIDTDKVISAGHCHTAAEALSSSITFDYETDASGNRILGYNPKFYKVKASLFHRYDSGGDYSILQLAQAPPGVPVIQMRHDIPAANEEIFGIHHPNGAAKKLSVPHLSGFQRVISSGAGGINVNLDVSGGSSGSGLFDTAGRITGVLSNGSRCSLSYFPTASVLKDIAPAPPVPVTRDVMVVFDRSGSMSQNDAAGRAKIDAARDALSLFVQLVSANTGNRLGLVSFSTQAQTPADFALAPVTAATKFVLVGNAPFSGGIAGGLNPGGATSIGDGLDKARQQFPGPGANPRAILLMTDGMENTPPTIAAVDGALNGIDIHAIGFGAAGNIDSTKLANLVAAHNGKFTRAESGVGLEKFFSLAFGNIFEAGILMDPEYDLPAGQATGTNVAFGVCGEEQITIVLGWNHPDAALFLKVTTPGGVEITGATAGVVSEQGTTWTFIKIPLPFNGERDGLWQVAPVRPGGGGEFPPPAPALHYFINIVPTGGPKLLPAPDKKLYYTGDVFNPMVYVRYPDGTWPDNIKVKLRVTYPSQGPGNILSDKKIHPPATVGQDTIPALQATFSALEQAAGHPLITYAEQVFDLAGDGANTSAFEAAGLFGKPLKDFLKMEGHYQFHFIATYGDGCTASRELLTTLYVRVGIDPSRTVIVIVDKGPRADGKHTVVFTVTPRDQYGNNLGPGQQEEIVVSAIPGTVPGGTISDNGDGSYSIPGTWDPAVSGQPGVVIGQPGRPGVVVQLPPVIKPDKNKYWFWLCLLLFLLLILLLILFFWYH